MSDGKGRGLLDRSTGDLIRQLIEDANALVDLQIQLAKIEARENLLSALSGGKSLGIAAGLALLALIGLVVFLVTGLAAIFAAFGVPVLGSAWFWALVLAVLFGALAALFGWRGIKKLKVSPLQRTREALREDVEWLQQPMRRNGR